MRAVARLIRLSQLCVVARGRILSRTAAARGSRDLVAALIGMLSAIGSRCCKKTIKRFVEGRAVGFVLDQRRRQRLVHPRALEPDGRDRIHRIDRFRNRDSNARISQRPDKPDELIAEPRHLSWRSPKRSSPSSRRSCASRNALWPLHWFQLTTFQIDRADLGCLRDEDSRSRTETDSRRLDRLANRLARLQRA